MSVSFILRFSALSFSTRCSPFLPLENFYRLSTKDCSFLKIKSPGYCYQKEVLHQLQEELKSNCVKKGRLQDQLIIRQ
ncbi:uncharacterized protein LOC142527646 isoform X4 [Primulina tabacum]|uniref:uncharacterized protein LOC142527646 isoform X4 n=1 Tax=Primulina tabacum TaxID=48773 RepID=UPI003F5ABD2A